MTRHFLIRHPKGSSFTLRIDQMRRASKETGDGGRLHLQNTLPTLLYAYATLKDLRYTGGTAKQRLEISFMKTSKIKSGSRFPFRFYSETMSVLIH